ncbi:MAG: M42 family peptidase [Clostridia bacterium]|nr:M42 family peptidase [Clostridia bacterium]
MKRNELVELSRKLSNANGASGFEDDVVKALYAYAEKYGDVLEDKLRNLYCFRKGNTGKKPVVQLDAHTDEVSFIVQAVKPNGTLRFLQLGRWVDEAVAGQKVRVRNALGEYIPGVVATTPPHYRRGGSGGGIDTDQMTIDVGASSKEEAEKAYHIRIGEPVVPDSEFYYDEAHDRMFGKAFDCRLGCSAIVGTLDTLKDEELDVDVIAGWACQEEMGMRGAVVTANRIKPDVAIVFEGCPADDTCAEDYMVQTALDKGPMLRFIDAKMITHPRFQRYALDLGEKRGIPLQSGVRSGGATNGAPIHLAGLGIPVIVIGIPVRYIHAQFGISASKDLENASKLAAEVIRSLNQDVIDAF